MNFSHLATLLTDTVILENSLWKWLSALFVAVLVFGATLAFRYRIGLRLTHLASKRFGDLSALKIIDAILCANRKFLILIIALALGSQALTLPDKADLLIEKTGIMALLIQIGIWAVAGIGQWVRNRSTPSGPDGTGAIGIGAIGFLIKLVVWTLVFMVALDNLGVNITALITGLGVGGIAVALATQNILGDLFASMSIVFDKPFLVGDFIAVGDMLGTVERVGLKTTHVRSLSGEQLIFSNADLLNSRIRNYKRMEQRRVVFEVRVIYESNAEQLQEIPKIIRETIEKLEKTRFDRSHFARFGQFSHEIETVYFVLSPDYNIYMDIQQSINLALLERFKERGIELAYPTKVIYTDPGKLE